MKIKILGAAGGEVTGSAYYVQTKRASVLTHGEDEPRQILSQKIQERFKLKAALPGMGETIEL
jgi:hypothetical protein